MHKFAKEKKIGEGAFGKAWLVHKKDDLNSRFVIKEVNISKMSRREKDDARNEITVLSQMKHPNIVSYQGSFEEAGKLYILMDYCDGGDLHTKISSLKNQLFDEDQIINWFVQLCLGIKHIHDRKILHRDIKTQNIFLNRQATIVKVGDFGISKVMNSTVELARTCIGTPYYLSPEICEGRPYNHKSDVWSLGCVLYELVSLKHAFEAGNMNNLVLKIIKGSYPALPTKYTKELRNLVGILLKRQPKDRPSVNEILKSPIIKARIERFLSETLLNNEFSHTVLHRKKPDHLGLKAIGEVGVSKSEQVVNQNQGQFKIPARYAKPKEPEPKFAIPKERLYKPDAIYGAPIVPRAKIPINKPKQFFVPPQNAAQLHAAKNRRFEMEAQENKRKALLQVKKDNLEKQRDKMHENLAKRQQQNIKNKARQAGWRNSLISALVPHSKYNEKMIPKEPNVSEENKGKFAQKKEAVNAAVIAQQGGADAVDRAHVVQEFIARRQEAAKIKARNDGNIFAVPAQVKSPKIDLKPANILQDKNKVETDYLAKLEAIRLQNFQARKRKLNPSLIEPKPVEKPFEKTCECSESLIARIKHEVELKPPPLPLSYKSPIHKNEIRNKWGPPSKPIIPAKFEFTGSQMEATQAVINEIYIPKENAQLRVIPEGNRGKWAQPTNTIVSRLESLNLAETALPELKIEEISEEICIEDEIEDRNNNELQQMSKTYLCSKKEDQTELDDNTITVEDFENEIKVPEEIHDGFESKVSKLDSSNNTEIQLLESSQHEDTHGEPDAIVKELVENVIVEISRHSSTEDNISHEFNYSHQNTSALELKTIKPEISEADFIQNLINQIISNATKQFLEEQPDREITEQLTFVVNEDISDEEAGLSKVALDSIDINNIWASNTTSNNELEGTKVDIQQLIREMESTGEGDLCFQEYSKFLEDVSLNSDLEYEGTDVYDDLHSSPCEIDREMIEASSMPNLTKISSRNKTHFSRSVSNTDLKLGIIDIEDNECNESNDEFHSMLETMRCLLEEEVDSNTDEQQSLDSDSDDDDMNVLSIYGILEKSRIELEKKIEPSKLMDAYNLLHSSCSLESLTSQEGFKTQTQLISTIIGEKDDVNDALLQLTIADLTYLTVDSCESTFAL